MHRSAYSLQRSSIAGRVPASSIRAATSFAPDMWTAWLAPEASTLRLLAFHTVARILRKLSNTNCYGCF